MFDERLRHSKEALFIRIAQVLRVFHWHPIWLTAVALFFGLLAAVLLWQQAYGWGFLCWFLNRLFDGLDGTVARVQDLQSDLGGYVDILADFVIYAAIPIGLAAAQPETAVLWALIFLLATFYVNAASWMYLSAILEKRRRSSAGVQTSVEMPGGLIGGAETIVFFSAFIIFPQWLPILFAVMGGMVIATTLQRLIWAARILA